MAISAVLGWIALILQFYVTISYSLSKGMSFLGGVVAYFSYFTILTNLLVAVSYTFQLLKPKSGLGKFFSDPKVKSAIAVYITFVGLGYSLLLRHLWKPQGIGWVADELLHDVTPVLYVIYWFMAAPKGILNWKNIAPWLIYPAIYFIYALIKGSITGVYPYPFIDLDELGIKGLLINLILLIIGFSVMGFIYVATNRALGKAYKTNFNN